MTRLTENDIQHIRRRMAQHDEELTRQTGRGLTELAMLAAGGDRRFLKRLHTARVGIIPLTTGQGIIGGFSDSVAAILSYIGMDCFVTDQPDAAGIAEAVERGAGQIFIADDLTCTMIDLHAHCSVENSACTGRAFAAALAARAGDLHHRSVTVLGAGVVGREGAEFLRGRGADIVLYDCDPTRTEAFRGRPHFYLAGSLDEALAASNLYLEATTAPELIGEDQVDADTIIAAPGIPCGVSPAVMERHAQQIIHDPLELGVAAMACTLQVEAALHLFDENKKIG